MTLLSRLNSLETSGLIRLAQAQPELAYAFRHALVQDAAYDSLVKADRKHLHQAVGEALERLGADRLDELAPLLGRHFDEAGDEVRALKYYTLAGDASARAYANAEAVLHYTRALDIAQRTGATGAPLTQLLNRLGRVYELSARYDDALRHYESMETLARERGDRALELAALVARITIHATPTARHDPVKATTLSQQALTLAHTLGDRSAEAKVYWNLILVNRVSRHFGQALRYGQQAIAIARELGLREQLAYALHDVAWIYSFLGQRERGRAARDEARALWRELGNLPMLADSLTGAAMEATFGGDSAQAVSMLEEAYELSRTSANLWGQAYSRWHLGNAFLGQGEVRTALSAFEEAFRLSESAGFLAAPVNMYSTLAILYSDLGAVERAMDAARLCVARAEKMPALRATALASLALLHARHGSLDEARASLDAARRHSAGDEADTTATLFRAEAELALREGHPAEALTQIEPVIKFVRQRGAFGWLAQALYLQARALVALDRQEEAHAVLTETCQLAERVSTRFTLWQCLATLSRIESQRGQHAEAQSLRRQAREVVAYIAHHAPAELRASFLNLPEVQGVMRET
jgi:tetratricopeptide (TPR) repeat protein